MTTVAILGQKTKIHSWFWVLLFCFATMGIAAGGVAYYRWEVHRITNNKNSEIGAIAKLKADQIFRWRSECLADARLLARRPSFARLAAQWHTNPGDTTTQQLLLEELKQEQDGKGYTRLCILDTGSDRSLWLPAASDQAAGLIRQTADMALHNPDPIMTELHRMPSGDIEISVASVVHDNSNRSVGVVILTANAADFLYPLIQSWPTSSNSAETLLVRRDGNDVLFLNELRLQSQTALLLRLPLSLSTLPAARAALGKEGSFQGHDYRGIPVLANLKSIPGTAWHMVAKVDTSEIVAEVRYRAVVSVLIVVLLVVCVGWVITNLYRKKIAAESKRADEMIQTRLRLLELAGTHSLLDFLRNALDEVEETTRSSIGFYHFVQPDQKTLELKAWSTRTARDFCAAEGKGIHYNIDEAGVWADCLRQRQPIIHNHYASLPNRCGLPVGHATVGRKLLMPILRNDRLVAVLGVGNKKEDYTEDDVRLATYLGDIIWELASGKLVNESLELSRQRMVLHVENTPLAVIEWDLDFRVRIWNAAAQRVFGYSSEEACGRHGSLVLPESVLPMVEEIWNSLLSQTGVRRSISENITKDGRVILCEWFNTPLVDQEGKTFGVASLVQDVTQQKRAEKELNRLAGQLKLSNDELRHFASIISHDLRAPLVNLQGFSAELSAAIKLVGEATIDDWTTTDERRREPLDIACRRDIPEALGYIQSAVVHMDSYITALLKLNRIGHSEIKLELIDMNTLVEETLTAFSHQIRERSIRVTVEALPAVKADCQAMKQIIANLLDNAIKYMDSRRPGHIEVSGYKDGNDSVFRISDTGRGINPDDMDKIFVPFRRAGKQDVPGEGMGLAFVQALIRRHGGRIQCESQPGVGTTFTFIFPDGQNGA